MPEIFINLKVKASARNNLISGFIVINDKPHLKLSIKAVPENGKANAEILNYLAREWHISRNNLEITKGHTSNLKTLSIKSITRDYLNLILKPYI